MYQTSSASQAVKVVSDDDEDDQGEKNPRHLTTSEAFQHLDDLLYFSMLENDATVAGLIVEVTDKIQNINFCYRSPTVVTKRTDCFIFKNVIALSTTPPKKETLQKNVLQHSSCVFVSVTSNLFLSASAFKRSLAGLL